MKSNLYTLVIFFAAVFAVASCDHDAWDDLPGPVATFFTTYFPAQEVESYSTSGGVSVASVKGGVTVTFNSGNAWTDVNGNGSPLPEIFLFDQLPEPLYRYLRELEVISSGVYRVSRSDKGYVVELLDSTVRYSLPDGVITGPVDS